MKQKLNLLSSQNIQMEGKKAMIDRQTHKIDWTDKAKYFLIEQNVVYFTRKSRFLLVNLLNDQRTKKTKICTALAILHLNRMNMWMKQFHCVVFFYLPLLFFFFIEWSSYIFAMHFIKTSERVHLAPMLYFLSLSFNRCTRSYTRCTRHSIAHQQCSSVLYGVYCSV